MIKIASVLKLCYLSVTIITFSCGTRGQIMNKNIGFENGNFSPEWRISRGSHETSINKVVSDPHPVRSGDYSMHLKASIDYRNELVYNKPYRVGRFNFDEEYWLGASVYLKDYNTNPYPSWLTIIQTHSVPGNEDWDGCCSGNSGWTLHASGDRLVIHSEILSDSYKVPSCASLGGSAWEAPLSKFENQWIDVVINFKHSIGSDGFIKWWINGELVVDLKGPNIHYYDECGVQREEYTYLQVGIYKEVKRIDITREMYLDEIRIGNKEASYNDVSPR